MRQLEIHAQSANWSFVDAEFTMKVANYFYYSAFITPQTWSDRYLTNISKISLFWTKQRKLRL